MFYNITIPKQFHIIQNRPDLIEIRSKYHYWRITEYQDGVILSHKYNINDCYHKQGLFPDPYAAFRYIKKHDNYFSNL